MANMGKLLNLGMLIHLQRPSLKKHCIVIHQKCLMEELIMQKKQFSWDEFVRICIVYFQSYKLQENLICL